MSLKDEIDSSRSTIHTDAYAMSIGELTALYRDGELDIHPEFQRFYRWTDGQKSRLIESILLGIPIPSIFVSQREDGVFDVIDGLQRLSTIFQFQGILLNESGSLVPPLVLRPTRYLPSLGGRVWDENTAGGIPLDREHQLLVKRAKLDLRIVLRESDEASKYELFQRLNTGGSPLSDQELRNCILIMVRRDFFDWFQTLGKDENFQSCIALNDRLIEEQYDLELVARFLTFRMLDETALRNIGEIGDFLNGHTIKFAESTEYDRVVEENAFHATFKWLAETLGENSFKRFDQAKGRFLGPFLISAFEAVALGLGHHARSYMASPPPDMDGIVKRIWQDERFQKGIGSGVRASSRIPVTIPLGRELFAP